MNDINCVIRGTRKAVGMLAAVMMFAACNPAAMVDVPRSSTLVDPSTIATPGGAMQIYNFAVSNFANRLGGTGDYSIGGNNMVATSALFTDELMHVQFVG